MNSRSMLLPKPGMFLRRSASLAVFRFIFVAAAGAAVGAGTVAAGAVAAGGVVAAEAAVAAGAVVAVGAVVAAGRAVGAAVGAGVDVGAQAARRTASTPKARVRRGRVRLKFMGGMLSAADVESVQAG